MEESPVPRHCISPDTLKGSFFAFLPFGFWHVSDLELKALGEDGSGRRQRGKGPDRNNSWTYGSDSFDTLLFPWWFSHASCVSAAVLGAVLGVGVGGAG